jgi:hypothetical protein
LAIDFNLIQAALREAQQGPYLVEPLPGNPGARI